MSTEGNRNNEATEATEERPLPSLDVAEAKIAQALIRYQVRVTKGALVKEKEQEKERGGL